MKTHRKYGQPPSRVILVHGGPGAVGEMSPVARQLASGFGVMECLNRAFTIDGQLLELTKCADICSGVKPIVVGFSWGAWLSILFAAQYPDRLNKLILISSGPLEEKYAQKIHETRMNRLEIEQREEFYSLLKKMETTTSSEREASFKKLGLLVSQSDSFDPIEDTGNDTKLSPEVYYPVWKEASKLRRSGQLLDYFNSITCPIVAIHGDYDPHPSEGIRIPGEKSPCDFHFELLKNCGHKPWIEKQAKVDFYRVLEKHLNES